MTSSPDSAWAAKFYRRTVTENPYLSRAVPKVWEGPNAKQYVFLTYPAKEALFGGAAGGGKSVAMLAAALQFVTVPGYSALLLRRTFADLNLPKALIPLSHSWLSGTDAAWNGQQYRWTFPSGATLSFGYLATDLDKYRYQGAEFQAIFFDELTQFPEASYRYLMSRLRRPTGLNVPLRMRAASNPGGVGHQWVRARFIDPATRDDRLFIPAKLEDNPHLDRDYEESLAALDPVTRAQLRHGDWNIRADAGVFKPEWFRYWTGDGEFYRLGDRVVRAADCTRFASADVAGTEKHDANDPDFSVIQVWDLTPTFDLVLLDQWRAQAEVPDVEDALLRVCRQWDVDFAAVEKNGMGTGVVQSAKRRGLTVHPMVARRGADKVTRSQTAQIRMEGGTVWLPAGKKWVEDLTAELASFPTPGVHDDQVDTLVWACHVAQRAGGPVSSPEDAAHESAQAALRAEAEELAAAPGSAAAVSTDPPPQDIDTWLSGR